MTAKLTYTHPTGGATTTSLTINAVRGGSVPDEMEFHPPLQYQLMGGGKYDHIAGFRRVVTLDFGVINSAATINHLLYFIQDEGRQLNTALSAPANLTGSEGDPGGLPTDTYYYVVTAVDEVYETIGSTEKDIEVVGIAGNIDLMWDAVPGAHHYNLYRSTTSGTYNSPCLVTRTTSTSYTDAGNGETTDFTEGAPPSGAANMALLEPAKFASEWLNSIEYGRKFVLKLKDRSIRTYWQG